MHCNVCGIDGPSITDFGAEFGANVVNGISHRNMELIKMCGACKAPRPPAGTAPATVAVAPAVVQAVQKISAPRVEAMPLPAPRQATSMSGLVDQMRARLAECEAIVASAESARAEADQLRRMLAVISN